MDDMAEMVNWYAIYKALMRYCRGIDRCDIDLVLSAFHKDATVHYFNGLTGKAWDVFSRYTVEGAASRTPQRTISNVIVEFDGDTAYSEAYAVAYYTMPAPSGGEQLVTWGIRYIDKCTRRDGAWRISDRKVVHDWDTVAPVSHDYAQYPSWMTGRLTGSMSRADPSYSR